MDYDVATAKELFRGNISRESHAVVWVWGDVDKDALDKLIQILVMTRNDWDALTTDAPLSQS